MRIRREDLKRAIDAIAGYRPEISHALDTMLARGHIDIPAPGREGESRLFFRFGSRKIFINKFQFFNSGTVPLEQALVIQYAEMARARVLLHQDPDGLPGAIASQTHRAGLSFLVDFEMERARQKIESRLKRLDGNKKKSVSRISACHRGLDRLAEISREPLGLPLFEDPSQDSQILFRGILPGPIRAEFHSFPFCREALIQAAALDLEFFHIRFLIDCLMIGRAPFLFACSVKGRLKGLVFLELKKKLFYTGLEIKYIATKTAGPVRGRNSSGGKGAGTFLVAGVWMHWKTALPQVREIFLESEIPAEGFYKAMGFHQRGPYRYVLTFPEGRLLNAVAAMAAMAEPCSPAITSHLCKRVSGRIRRLKKQNPRHKEGRKRALEFLKVALHPASSHLLAQTAVDLIRKNRDRIPEATALLDLAKAFGRTHSDPGALSLPAAIVSDRRYHRHLEGITHLESRKRILAMEEVLSHPDLKGRWFKVPPRHAREEELAWVHTRSHIEKIRQTSGKTLLTLDMDTQTTETSWDTARLAAGGVFSLVDAIMEKKAFRGFASVRPPGHHAGIDRAMGFCIFNNIALGARYLKHQYQASRVMIIDLDAHHGNGTQEIFYDSDEVLFLSVHESKSFPGTGLVHEKGQGRGQGFTINIPLEKGSRARDIGRALYFIAGPVAQSYKPEIILVSLGFDFFIHDCLSGMKVTPGGYAVLTALLLEIACRASGGKILFVLEGGYSVQGIRECGLAVIKEICGISAVDPGRVDRVRKSDPTRLASLQKVVRAHRPHWKVLL
ncbi:histone deacetylase family protein [Desulfospira joergensenii]|uniref:histone deacetylase family protein n=1 Tax=Desulfospira joergensenii TaxID=53329 RepID=UPI00040AE221|nr:histone deacetylase [Desulfospira joergensenii]